MDESVVVDFILDRIDNHVAPSFGQISNRFGLSFDDINNLVCLSQELKVVNYRMLPCGNREYIKKRADHSVARKVLEKVC